MKNWLTYRLKILLKDKSLVFWTLVFPILLATFFNLALRGAYTNATVSSSTVGVVVSDPTVQSFLDMLEDEYHLIEQKPFSNEKEALAALENQSVEALITYDSSIHLSVTQSSSNAQSLILRNVLQSYNVRLNLIQEQLESDPTKVTPAFIDSLVNVKMTVTSIADSRTSELVVINFYTTIAMLCIYASFWGNKSGRYLQADMSSIGIRLNVSPTHKWKLILMDIAAIFVIFALELAIHLSYMAFVLQVPFGNYPGLLILTGLIGGLLSAMMGYMVCVMVKGNEVKRITLLSGVGVFLSFLSGMMAVQIKYLVETYLPVLSKINPAALITDNFYWIFMESHFSLILENLLIMVGLTIVFAMIAYRRMRRVTYDHL